MKTLPRRFIMLCGIVPVLAAGALALFRPAFLTPLEYRTYDTLVRSAGTRPHSGEPRVVRGSFTYRVFGFWGL